MKKLALLALVLNFSTQAFAFDTLQDKCFKKAATATAKLLVQVMTKTVLKLMSVL